MEDDTEALARESGCTGASCGLSQNRFVRSVSVLLLCLLVQRDSAHPTNRTLETCSSHAALILYNKLDGVLN